MAMRQLAFLVAWLLTMAVPAEAPAGAMTLRLPFSLWGMAKCESEPGQAVTAACRWSRNDRHGYNLHCEIDSEERSARTALTLEIDTWWTGENTLPRDLVTGRKFNYEHSGIACMAHVPSTMFDLECSFGKSGFGCSWCGRYNCYAGEARIREGHK
jgi:hypothetical protein